ncbi:hypothetical protein SEA_TYKE_16 [Mycobacterium phage Tyke]|uniref:Uncharacterized protein n=13 Tax=Bixzunavirus TaxID=680114 RepID=Q853R1_BPMBZ|nr:gp16 [Mycobacterium phage Bxz1]YP_002224271.1 gp17 [Mycobacterium phage Spud]YP_009012798.1 hypothetical protein DANDELION_19 [Mycobacterium phage Dandelion]YP_009016478.1 hypothetical protein NAPPY_16 [Mycobacterium phage Nappy]YP_009017352.1 hypothetical protein MOMOMIXON_16 [Mycobacterium phage MoMoMixon]YP_010056967.1 hypothetical protein KHO58_gp019 [Mycobacterium phage Bigswole]YP_010057657.1 hypothetical protein KHO61_gp017 [Mycobacterium phage Mangeria]YP_010058112.1 hypothetical 
MNTEERFVTLDRDDDGKSVRFEMIEDEDGDVFWAYGHVPSESMVAEVNRWLTHCGLEADVLAPSSATVDHVWARFTDNERFSLEEPIGKETDTELFPVTRLYWFVA